MQLTHNQICDAVVALGLLVEGNDRAHYVFSSTKNRSCFWYEDPHGVYVTLQRITRQKQIQHVRAASTLATVIAWLTNNEKFEIEKAKEIL